jgi:hypothetical protein
MMLTLIVLLITLVALHHVTAHAHALLFFWSRRLLRLFGPRLDSSYTITADITVPEGGAKV